MDWIIKLVFSILGISWFVSIFRLIRYSNKKYPKMYRHKSFLGISFSLKDGNQLWKEVFKSSIKNDQKYKFILYQVRIILILFILIGIYWTYLS